MVNCVPRLEWSFIEFVGKPMRPKLFPLTSDLEIKQSVAVQVSRAAPVPAFIRLINLAFKTCYGIGGLSSVSHVRNYTTKYTEWIGKQFLRSSLTVEELALQLGKDEQK